MSTRCAVCKHTRSRCPADCVFAPHFPGDNMERFFTVKRSFGVEQLKEMLTGLPPNQRQDAVNSLLVDAEGRHLDTVYGNPGVFTQLQRLAEEETHELYNVRSTVDTFGSLGIEPTYSATENLKFMKMNKELSQKCQGINQEGVLKSEGESSMMKQNQMKIESVKLGKPESYAEALRRPPPKKIEIVTLQNSDLESQEQLKGSRGSPEYSC